MSAEASSGIRLQAGQQIGEYQVEEVLDSGANAFAGRAVSPRGEVFLKKYKNPGGSSNWYDPYVTYQKRLKARLDGNLKAKEACIGFVDFFEVKKPGQGQRKGLKAFYQAFEWVEGMQDLRRFLDAQHTEVDSGNWWQRVNLAQQMLYAVSQIHAAGIVHSDLKPENFIIVHTHERKHWLRLIDMDFSLIENEKIPWVDGLDPNERLGYFGTPGYLSPEHLQGIRPSQGSDIFTCGVILRELLGEGHPAADNKEAYPERVRTQTLLPIRVRYQIEGVKDYDRLHALLDRCFGPLDQRPSAKELFLALEGKEWLYHPLVQSIFINLIRIQGGKDAPDDFSVDKISRSIAKGIGQWLAALISTKGIALKEKASHHEKKPLIPYILITFFAGWCGVNNFYSGQWIRGCLKLFVLIQPWLGSAITTAIWSLGEIFWTAVSAETSEKFSNLPPEGIDESHLSAKRRSTFLYLTVFLGWCGANNFYVGQHWRGAIKIFLLPQIWFGSVLTTFLWSCWEMIWNKKDGQEHFLR
jgi:serine/threonine protein kinase